jgi:hypothetical protein
MDQMQLSRTLAAGANYYAGVGGIAPDGSVTQGQLSVQMVSAYNDAYQAVLDTSYYNTQMLLEDQADVAMDNLSLAIDNLVDATATFATVGAVAEMAAEAEVGTVEEQIEVQNILEQQDMTITEADVQTYNTAVEDVEKYAQEAAGFLAASMNTEITASTDNWAENNQIELTQYTSITYDATTDLLIMDFYNQSNGAYGSVGYEGFLYNSYKTAEDIYNTGIAYGG